MLPSSVEMLAQQEFYCAVTPALSALHGASSVLSSAAAAPDSECELVPGTHPKDTTVKVCLYHYYHVD